MAWGKGLVSCLRGKIFVLAAIISVLSSSLIAQPLKSSVTLKRGSITLRVCLEEPKIPMGGIFLLKIQAVAPGDLYGDAVKFELPAIWADRVVQLSAISDRETFEQGGRIWTRITYTYRLAPLVLGRIRFDGLQVTVLKERFLVPTIEGVVLSGAFQEPQQPVGPPVKVSAAVSAKSVFVGEQLVYTLRFSSLANTEFETQPTYEAPPTEGFWSEEFPRIERSYSGSYETQLVRIALFPLRDGELKIGRAKVTVRLQSSPLLEELQTTPFRIKVKPLPQPAPEGFQNLIGFVSASVEFFPDTLGVGETLTVRLKVEGTANLRNLEQPPTLSLPDAVVGLPRSKLSTMERDGKLWFIREFTWRVVPRKEGQLVIPSFRVPYFDPKEQRYKFATTKPATVRVLPGAVIPASVSPAEERRTLSPLLPVAGAVLLIALFAGVTGLRYMRRRKLLITVQVSDPQLRRTVLTFHEKGATAFGYSLRDWLREQIYQRTGVLLSPNDTPEKVRQLLLTRGISEAAVRSIEEVWDRADKLMDWEEAVNLLLSASELPQRL